MSQLSTAVKDAAMAGDYSALDQAFQRCREFPADAAVCEETMDIIFYVLRKTLHPNTPFQVTIPGHRGWLEMVLACLQLMIAGIHEMLAVDPIRFKNQLQRGWHTDIWPCIQLLSNGYIYNHIQPTVEGPNFDLKEDALIILNSMLQAMLTSLDLVTLLRTSQGIVVTMTELTMSYIFRFSHLRLGLFVVVMSLDSVEEIGEEMGKDVNFFSSAIPFLKEHYHFCSAEESTWIDPIGMIHAIFASAPFSNSIEALQRSPELLEVLLAYWKMCLVTFGGIVRNDPDDISHTHDSPLSEIMSSVMYLMGAFDPEFTRIALKRHVVPLLLWTCHLLPLANEILHDLGLGLQLLSSYMAHYSVLDLLLTVFFSLDSATAVLQPLSQLSSGQRTFWRLWSVVCDIVVERGLILIEFKRARKNMPALCGNPNCPKDKPSTSRKRCSGCEYEHYCSKLCQSTDWKRHKTFCEDPYIKFLSTRNSRDLDFLEYMAGYHLQEILSSNPSYRGKSLVLDYTGSSQYPPRLQVLEDQEVDEAFGPSLEVRFTHRQKDNYMLQATFERTGGPDAEAHLKQFEQAIFMAYIRDDEDRPVVISHFPNGEMNVKAKPMSSS